MILGGARKKDKRRRIQRVSLWDFRRTV